MSIPLSERFHMRPPLSVSRRTMLGMMGGGVVGFGGLFIYGRFLLDNINQDREYRAHFGELVELDHDGKPIRRMATIEPPADLKFATVRKDPSKDSAEIYYITKAELEVVEVLGNTYQSDDGRGEKYNRNFEGKTYSYGQWFRIRLDFTTVGYLSGNFVNVEENPREIEPPY